MNQNEDVSLAGCLIALVLVAIALAIKVGFLALVAWVISKVIGWP